MVLYAVQELLQIPQEDNFIYAIWSKSPFMAWPDLSTIEALENELPSLFHITDDQEDEYLLSDLKSFPGKHILQEILKDLSVLFQLAAVNGYPHIRNFVTQRNVGGDLNVNIPSHRYLSPDNVLPQIKHLAARFNDIMSSKLEFISEYPNLAPEKRVELFARQIDPIAYTAYVNELGISTTDFLAVALGEKSSIVDSTGVSHGQEIFQSQFLNNRADPHGLPTISPLNLYQKAD